MADLRTEEEQVEAIKSWWKENGRSTVLGIVVAVAVVLGWRGWQEYQRNTVEMASAEYQRLLSMATVQPGQTLPEEQRKTAEHLATELKANYEGLAYAQYAALWLSKSAVEQGDLDRARNELDWVLKTAASENIASVARLRLARVLLAQEQYDQALAQLNGAPRPGYEASFYEVKGDVYLAMGREDEARSAYEKAQAAPRGEQRPVLGMKLDDLASEAK